MKLNFPPPEPTNTETPWRPFYLFERFWVEGSDETNWRIGYSTGGSGGIFASGFLCEAAAQLTAGLLNAAIGRPCAGKSLTEGQ